MALDFRFKGVTSSLPEFLAHADGQFHLGVQPRQLEKPDSGYRFVDLAFAVISLLEYDLGSQVNCILGSFNPQNGLAPGVTLLIDLTEEQIRGEGTINVKTRTLNLVFNPEPKQLVFKLPLPVRVSGNFANYGFNPTPRKLTVTLAH